jgi:fructokinase
MRIGVDMGGTKIEAIAIDAGGKELVRRRVATPRSYDGTLDAVVDLVIGVEREMGMRGTVGVGIPGTVSPVTRLVKNANSVWLIGRSLDADLEGRLGRPVRMTNDANCFALSEASDGAGAGAPSVFGVILGTGVGGGIVIGGHVIEGASRIAGEWGHNPLPRPHDSERPGPQCWCGRRGCIETFCSGPAMERDHLEATGEALSAVRITERAEAGDAGARATLDRYVERLARSLAGVVNILDPEVVVLGGGVSNVPTLAGRVQALLPLHVFTDEVATRVVKNVHGDSSGVRGAAWLWPEREGDRKGSRPPGEKARS